MSNAITNETLEDCMPALKRFALSLTKNPERANDLTQDCLERALRKQHLFDGENLRAWLFTMCRRVFLNQIRSEKTKGVAVDIDDAPQSKIAKAETQEIAMHFKDVADAFEQLPLNDKVVLSLIVIEGLKYEEAAQVLDVPIGTIRSRLSRARARLEVLINGEDAEEQGTRAAVHV